MEELVRMVVEKTGIPEDKARMAVEVVLSHVRSRLPAGVSGQLDSALQGGGGSALGGMLGGKLGG